MKFTQLKNDIAQGARGIYLLEGDDAYFRSNAEEMIKSAFLQFPELNFTSFDGESLKGSAITELTSALQNYPFMAEKRIVKVSEFYPAESEFEARLKPLFSNFPSTSILIIVNSGAKKGVDLKRKGGVTYIDCNRADEEDVAKWAYVTLKKAGIAASADACTQIARYCVCNMARVSVEVKKIIDYKVSGALTRAEVEELVYKDAEYRTYEMTNAVAYRDFDKFNAVLNDMCRRGDELSVLSGLYSYFKNLLTIISFKGSDAELAAAMKMKEYGVKKSREQAIRIGEKKLRELVNAIYARVADIKSGAMTPQSALQTVKNALFF